ncbi:PREDICTED: interleukin-2 [Chrysochloris asiatica]|uniref:Interleukin-2 n=1 Tax=Chrysochloris asiatica TaxID=185453 RepID=A0A9B0TK59_CHRAS|nr:PREDICTED: interleukin-2 [Chrysochloris asiatica]
MYYRMQLLSCIALTLALLTNSAPTSSSTREIQQQMEQLLLDLQMVLNTVTNSDTPKRSTMCRFKLNMPKKVTELKHLQCFVEELKALEDVLKVAQSKIDTREIISNMNVTALKLKGSETTFMCEYDDKEADIIGFLNKWITFCQSILATLT